MVWLYKPSGNYPIGSMIASTSSPIAGNTWNVWVREQRLEWQAVRLICSANELNSLSFDLNLFIKDAVTRGYVRIPGASPMSSPGSRSGAAGRAADHRLLCHVK